MNVTINNQCSNIELTSLAYLIKDTTCHGYLPQQVNPMSRMNVNFKIDMYRSTFGGILLYHLQRKMNSELDDRTDTDKDMSINTQLLVIWEFRINRLYSHAWLIEHKSTLTWSEDKLEWLYDVYDSLYDTDIIFNEGEWLLDDNTKLRTVCEASYEGYLEMSIIISEEKDLFRTQKLLWVDSNR
jgi:hypothetical protein